MKRLEADTVLLLTQQSCSSASDGGLIQKASGFLTPEQFSPIMKDALKKETEFQEKLEKLKAKSDDAKLNAQVALTYLERERLKGSLVQ